jgi:hypothetical protein
LVRSHAPSTSLISVSNKAQISTKSTPVTTRARQARHLNAENQPDIAKTNHSDQSLKTESAFDRRPRSAKFIVDDHDRLARPAKLNGGQLTRIQTRQARSKAGGAPYATSAQIFASKSALSAIPSNEISPADSAGLFRQCLRKIRRIEIVFPDDSKERERA